MTDRCTVKRWSRFGLLAAVAGLFVAGAVAQGGPPAGADAKPKEEKKRFKDVKDVTEDMQATEGLITLYRFDANDKNKDPEKLLAKIPARLINEDLLFATSVARGGSFTGWMWNDYLFRWQIIGDHLVMVTPDTRYIAKKEQPIAAAIEATYGDSWIAALPILAMSPQGDVVVDFEKLLKSDIAGAGGIGGGQVRPELSRWTKVKVFPDNVLIEADLATGRGPGGGGYVGMGYAFQRLPKLGSYNPRTSDPRIGYFTTTRVDWAKPNSEREVAERYVNRWQLEKRDPSLELSPPKKPITFIIEKTTPIQWRRWVREGILDWNQAFEKIGFVDAIVVQQQTDDNEFANHDPEDARYNFIRWTVTGRALAVGPSRADPRTGQILDADIVMDDAWVRYFVTNVDFFTSGPKTLLGPGYEMLAERYPEFIPHVLRPAPGAVNEPDPLAIWAEARSRGNFSHAHNCGHSCNYAEGMALEMALAHSAMVASGLGKQIPERLIGEAVKEVITHEVGHTLGLRHNFKASSWLSLEEIRRRRDTTDEPTVASVMDYNPLLLFADDDVSKVKHFATPCIGPYDELAIEYGYRTTDKGEKEDKLLAEIAAKQAQPGNEYATDEDTLGSFSPDPMTNRYDMGNDPAAWARTRLQMCDKLLSTINEWSAKEGDPKHYVTQAFNTVITQKARNFEYVARVLGGQLYHRDHIGDPDGRPAFVQIEPAQQRGALKTLTDALIDDSTWSIPPELLNNMPPSRWGDFADRGAPFRVDYPIHDRVLGLQLIALMNAMSPATLQRVYDAELKSTVKDKLTAAELITSIRDAVWRQLDSGGAGNYSDASPMISSIARNLQRTYLSMMLSMAQMPAGSGMSADLNGMVRYALSELSSKIDGALKRADQGGKSRLDFATRAHLTQAKSEIDRVLNAQYLAR